MYNSAEWWEAQDGAVAHDKRVHEPFFLLRHGQALDLVSRLPVGGEAAGEIDDNMMRAILSDQKLVVALRQRGAQELLLHLHVVSALPGYRSTTC